MLAHHLLELLTSVEPELPITIHQYKNVFEKPHGLPPIRSHDSTIPLMPGNAPMKVRPYRYKTGFTFRVSSDSCFSGGSLQDSF